MCSNKRPSGSFVDVYIVPYKPPSYNIPVKPKKSERSSPRQVGRPRLQLDTEQITALAARGLSQADICRVLGISERTLSRRKQDTDAVARAIEEGKSKGAAQVANALFERAIAGDLGAIVWYEKTRRGLRDLPPQDAATGPVEIRVRYANDSGGAPQG